MAPDPNISMPGPCFACPASPQFPRAFPALNPGALEDSSELIKSLDLEILAQPDDHTCGPTCLHAVYRYYDRTLPLEQVINEAESLEGGGTLAVMLGHHALRRGFSARIYTYNLQVFDPTWFDSTPEFLMEKLVAQGKIKSGKRLQLASRAYQEFLRLGGEIRFEDMRPSLLRKYLKKGDRAYIDGRLRTRSWEGKDGVKRNQTEIIAQNLIMLGGAKSKPDQSSSKVNEEVVVEEVDLEKVPVEDK